MSDRTFLGMTILFGILVVGGIATGVILAPSPEAPKPELVADHDGVKLWRIREPYTGVYHYYTTTREGKVEWEKSR